MERARLRGARGASPWLQLLPAPCLCLLPRASTASPCPTQPSPGQGHAEKHPVLIPPGSASPWAAWAGRGRSGVKALGGGCRQLGQKHQGGSLGAGRRGRSLPCAWTPPSAPSPAQENRPLCWSPRRDMGARGISQAGCLLWQSAPSCWPIKVSGCLLSALCDVQGLL